MLADELRAEERVAAAAAATTDATAEAAAATAAAPAARSATNTNGGGGGGGDGTVAPVLPVRAVFFDWDGTLAAGALSRALRGGLAAAGADPTDPADDGVLARALLLSGEQDAAAGPGAAAGAAGSAGPAGRAGKLPRRWAARRPPRAVWCAWASRARA